MDQAIKNFADVVQRFCEWAESLPGDPLQEMFTVQRLLAELLSNVLALPDLEPSDDEHDDVLTVDQRMAVYKRFASLPVEGYWDTYDPLDEKEKEPAFNLLADDLGDIYRDLKEGLQLYNEGKISDAVWEWQFNFSGHWGRHLTSAQRAIYSYLN